MGGEVRRQQRGQITGPLDCLKDFGFYSEFNRKSLEVCTKSSLDHKRVVMAVTSEKSAKGISDRRY